MKKWVVTDPDTLRDICIKNHWFTCGTTRQYDKMFELNRIENGYIVYTVSDIALAIWICSNDVPYNAIYGKLHEANCDYRMGLALAQQGAAESAADEVYCGYYD